jgi:amidohydrolase
MPNRDELKAKAQAAIDQRRDWLIDIAKTVLDTPEPGFLEVKTSRLVQEKLSELGINHESGIAITGVKGYVNGSAPGPTVAVIGELDSVKVLGHPHADPETGAAHACGHHCQVGSLLGAAVGLMVPEVAGALDGRVAVMAVPAEEFIDVELRWAMHNDGKLGLMSGKQEFIRLGAFDDVDMAMMIHASPSARDGRFAVGGTSNGHLVKYVRFIGRAAHAGGAPHEGINALNAAMIALNAIHAQRETQRNEDIVRLHGIMTMGGAVVNSVPADVRYEGRVRAANADAMISANSKLDRCLRAGALAIGAKVNIITIPGYLPMVNDEQMTEVFKENAASLVPRSMVVHHPDYLNRGGSTDMGDLSQIMPAIHPYTGAAMGVGHGIDYLIRDYDQAVIKPAKALAMSVIDLLADGAGRAREVMAESPPRMTKDQYLSLQNERLTEELYEGK